MLSTGNRAKSFMGIDCGNTLHYKICQRNPDNGKIRFVRMGTVSEFDQLDTLIHSFDVRTFVVDALPDQHSARELCRRFKGRGWRLYYDRAKGEPALWKDDEMEVHVNRTETIDAFFDDIREGEVEYPVDDETEVVADHIYALVKQEEEDKTGKKVWRYIRTGDDHYAHAGNYARIAMSKSGAGVILAAGSSRGFEG